MYTLYSKRTRCAPQEKQDAYQPVKVKTEPMFKVSHFKVQGQGLLVRPGPHSLLGDGKSTYVHTYNLKRRQALKTGKGIEGKKKRDLSPKKTSKKT